MASIYTVAQINSYIKNMFQQDFVLNRVSVKGEISNLKLHTSGHIYFTLKDQNGTISVIMFASQANKLSFQMKEGQKVIVHGRIDVYERDGKYQLYANELQLDGGTGDLYKKFQELKNNLEEMGMFSNEYKRKIPVYSNRIGIVTASSGAAIQDIMNISKRRNPYIQLILYPAVVQGELAKYSIVKGIQTLDKMNLDLIIIGRGGGSIEDLWAFNEEIVARAIFNCNTPIISAVGHETDFTIADFVSDLRAPTPSAAAELAVIDIKQLEDRIYSYNYLLNQGISHNLSRYKNSLDKYLLKLNYLNPVNQIHDKRIRLMNLEDKLNNVIKNNIKHKKFDLILLSEKLNGLSPLNKLSRGYAFIQKSDGDAVHSIHSVDIQDRIEVHMSDGMIEASVISKKSLERQS